MTEAFPTIVYLLCFVTSASCAWLLGRSYAQTGTRLLLWSSVCFGFLAANNLLLFIDLVVWEWHDLRIPRLVLALCAALSLIWGFIWDSQEEAR